MHLILQNLSGDTELHVHKLLSFLKVIVSMFSNKCCIQNLKKSFKTLNYTNIYEGNTAINNSLADKHFFCSCGSII